MPGRILIVEDDDGHAELLARGLADHARYRPVVVHTLAAARAAVAAAAPALVLADWKLPDGHGTDLLPPDHAYPVVVLTSHGNEAVAVETIKAGALDYVCKSAQLFEDVTALVDRSLRTWGHVTERRRAEAALRESEARTAGIVSTAADAVLTTDEFGTIQTANPAAHAMFGFAPGSLVGQHIRELMTDPDRAVCPDYLARFRAAADARPPGPPREVTARRADGSTFPARLSVGTMKLDGQRVFAGILHDLTLLKRVERQFHQAQKLEAVGHLAGGVAHDFNNLLTVILGYGSLLQGMVPAGGAERAMLDEIVATADRAAGLTRQLLAVSRPPTADPVVLDPNRVLADLSRILRRLIGTVALESALDPAVGPVRIDPSHLEQVLLNLVVNARDAILPGAGTVTISTAAACLPATSADLPPGQPPGEYVVLTVADTGSGMTDEVKARVFEPFFTTKGPGKGTGLGLATVFGVVRHAGGFVAVDSAPGRGSTFAVHLPKAAAEPNGPRAAVSTGIPTGTETLLLADDDPGILRLSRTVLESAGYTVLAAADGREAVELAARYAGRIDAVVTDLVMPRLGGLGVVAEVRKARPDLPALLVSGYPEVPADAPAVTVLRKPFTPAALARKVREVLDRRESVSG